MLFILEKLISALCFGSWIKFLLFFVRIPRSYTLTPWTQVHLDQLGLFDIVIQTQDCSSKTRPILT